MRSAQTVEVDAKLRQLVVTRKMIAQEFGHLLPEEKVPDASMAEFQAQRSAADHVGNTRKAKVAQVIAAPVFSPGFHHQKQCDLRVLCAAANQTLPTY